MVSWTMYKNIGNGKGYYEGVCLSTDTKPVQDYIINGSKLMEMDTSKLFLYDAENETWREWGE